MVVDFRNNFDLSLLRWLVTLDICYFINTYNIVVLVESRSL